MRTLPNRQQIPHETIHQLLSCQTEKKVITKSITPPRSTIRAEHYCARPPKGGRRIGCSLRCGQVCAGRRPSQQEGHRKHECAAFQGYSLHSGPQLPVRHLSTLSSHQTIASERTCPMRIHALMNRETRIS